jgi:hypothetical protein
VTFVTFLYLSETQRHWAPELVVLLYVFSLSDIILMCFQQRKKVSSKQIILFELMQADHSLIVYCVDSRPTIHVKFVFALIKSLTFLFYMIISHSLILHFGCSLFLFLKRLLGLRIKLFILHALLSLDSVITTVHPTSFD